MQFRIQTGILNKKFYLHVGKHRMLNNYFLLHKNSYIVDRSTAPCISINQLFYFQVRNPWCPMQKHLDWHLTQSEWFRKEKNLFSLSGMKLQTSHVQPMAWSLHQILLYTVYKFHTYYSVLLKFSLQCSKKRKALPQ